jgi:hypothetical protein
MPRRWRDLRSFAFVVALAVTAACDANDAPDGDDPAPGGAAGEPGLPSERCGAAVPALVKADAAGLFASATVPTFDFYLPSESWEELKAHARDELYVPADVCFNGNAVGRVGLRFKGAYGSLQNCFDAAGVNTCRKLGMKVKFDEYEVDQRFYGLKRLNFQGYRYDNSYLRERLSYDLYREMGIVAPRAAWARLRVNDEEQGLFGMVEQVDGRFTANRWPDNRDGNLYKEVWPGTTDQAFIASHLETNEETAEVSSFVAFSEALNAAPQGDLRAVLGNYVDLDYFARYMAVDDAIANFDGVTTYYSWGNPDEAGNHNFFLYEESPQRFTLVPWDLESTLSLASQFGNVPPWQEQPEDCSTTYAVWNGGSQVVAPGCDPLFQGLAADLGAYRGAVRELLDGPFALARMNEQVDRHASFIRSEAERDAHGPGAQQFEQDLDFLKAQFPGLRRRLEHLASGEPTTPLVLDIDRLADFESTDAYGLHSGTSLLSNAATTTAIELDSDTPIAGRQSLRIRFEFGNEIEGWQQWMFYTIPLSTVPTDLSQRTGMRFKVRSNIARELRIDIESPNNSRANEGVKVGWLLSISPEVSEQRVSFADAKIPSWATATGDSLASILQSATGISFLPQCANRDVSGQLPAGTTDDGSVDLDEIEFF